MDPGTPPLTPSPALFYQERRLWLCFVAAVLLLGAWIYHPVRHYGYLEYDDSLFVRPVPQLTHGWHPESFRWAFLANLTEYSKYAEYWCPLTLLTRITDVQLFGDNPGAFHVTNLILHLANALLLALALRQFTGRAGPSYFVALVFLVHPLNAEVVCWLSARKDLVNGFFFFLTLLAYGWYVRRQTMARFLVLMLAYVGCLMAKPMGMTVPILLLVLDLWPLRRWRFGESTPAEGLRLLAEKLPLLLALPTGYLAVLSQHDWGSLVSTSRLTIPLRLENAIYSYAVYLRRIFWPSDLCCFYHHPMHSLTALQVGFSAFVLVAVTVATWAIRRRAPMFLAGWLWFAIVLGPVCGIMQLGSYGMADRYTYLAALGPVAATVWWLADHLPRRWQQVAGVAGIALGVWVTSVQATFWRDDQTAFTHAIVVSRGNWMAQENLGLSVMAKRRYADAYAHLRRTVELNPDWTTAWTNLADLQIIRGEDHDAIRCLATDLRMDGTNLRSMLLIGLLEKKLGDPGKAEAVFQRMLTVAPQDPQAHLELGNLYADSKRWPEAAQAWAAYLRVHPEDTATQHRYDEASHAPGL